MTGNVIGPAFGDEPNVIGALHELANRSDIVGMVIAMRLANGEYEHIRMGMDMEHHSHAAAVVQESALRRIRMSIDSGRAAP
jgi:hypothetical protein